MNNVTLMGRLVKDVELRYTSTNNTAVGSFTLAVEREFQKQGEEKKADFIPIIVWGKTAEFAQKYFAKGVRIALIGRIQVRSWDDDAGKKQFKTEVVAERVFFADAKKQTDGNGNSASNAESFYPLDSDDELPF